MYPYLSQLAQISSTKHVASDWIGIAKLLVNVRFQLVQMRKSERFRVGINSIEVN